MWHYLVYYINNCCYILTITYSSYTELGIEATEPRGDENNESFALLSFDGAESFGQFLSSPYDDSQVDKEISELKQIVTGDEFLPSQLLSDLLSGSTAEPTTKVCR